MTIIPRAPEVLADQSRLFLLALIRRFRSIADGESILMRDALSAVPRCRPVEAEILLSLLRRAPDLGRLSVTAFVAAWDRDGASMLSAGGSRQEFPQSKNEKVGK